MESITIKSQREILLMKEAGRIVALCHDAIKNTIKAGMTTNEVNDMVERIIVENDAIPTFKNYHGFPSAACVSVNEQIVHGMPSDYKLKDGDIISVDIGATYKGYVGDSAWTYAIGQIDPKTQVLLIETENSLFAGLDQVKNGASLNDVSRAIQAHAEKFKLGVVKEFAGHGVGRYLHEAPEILNYYCGQEDVILKTGMTLAIEPMLNLGTHRLKIHRDGWTTTTADKKPSAHFEHSILVTETGYEILTKL
jgi:methionyl aminopeptidase